MRDLIDCCRRPFGLVACLLVVGSLSAGSADAQTLGDLAKKEQERRKDAPPAGKMITNRDLKPGPKSEGSPAPSPATAPGEAGEAPKEGAREGDKDAREPAEKSPAQDEASWRKRMVNAREELRRAEMFGQALRTRINSLNRDLQSRDDPAQRERLATERGEAVAELERVEQDVERSRKAIADLEEEARKAGIPPGWLR